MAINSSRANNSANTANKTKKAFNPTITAMFENAKFGEGALLSANINAEGFEAIQKHIQIGSKLLVRKSPRLSKSGNVTYFLEVLPPLAEGNNIRRGNSSSSDEI